MDSDTGTNLISQHGPPPDAASVPRIAMPPTLLVTELHNGALIIQGRPGGPRVYLSRVDSMPLRRELAAAFGSAQRALPDDQGEAR